MMGLGAAVLGAMTLGAAFAAPVQAQSQSGMTYIRCSSTVTMSRVNNIQVGQRYTSYYGVNNGSRSVQEFYNNQWRGWQVQEFTPGRMVASIPNLGNCRQVATFDRGTGGYIRTTQCPSGATLSHQGSCDRSEAPRARPTQRF
jgi:hypothetical protein